jgi:hypothetical protein
MLLRYGVKDCMRNDAREIPLLFAEGWFSRLEDKERVSVSVRVDRMIETTYPMKKSSYTSERFRMCSSSKCALNRCSHPPST